MSDYIEVKIDLEQLHALVVRHATDAVRQWGPVTELVQKLIKESLQSKNFADQVAGMIREELTNRVPSVVRDVVGDMLRKRVRQIAKELAETEPELFEVRE